MKLLMHAMFSVIVFLGCRKPVAETPQSETQAREIAPPGAGEIQLVRDIMAKEAYKPSPEEIETFLLKKECLDIKASNIEIYSVKGGYAVLRSQMVTSRPGNIGCESVYTIFENVQGKWQVLNLPGTDSLTWLVDIDNDGYTDILRFRSQGPDGPAPIVSAMYMGTKEGKLTKTTDSTLENCLSMAPSWIEDHPEKIQPCSMTVSCDPTYPGTVGQTIKYDCKLRKFVAK